MKTVHLNASYAEAIASSVSLRPMHATFAITSPVAGLFTCHTRRNTHVKQFYHVKQTAEYNKIADQK